MVNYFCFGIFNNKPNLCANWVHKDNIFVCYWRSKINFAYRFSFHFSLILGHFGINSKLIILNFKIWWFSKCHGITRFIFLRPSPSIVEMTNTSIFLIVNDKFALMISIFTLFSFRLPRVRLRGAIKSFDFGREFTGCSFG